jgi:CBS domain-containing protein
MRIMSDKRFRHLPVVDRDRVLGVLSIGDLVRSVLEEQQQTIEELERYIRS